MVPTVVFAGGGTGGHLFPGFAVADELGREGVECIFMGTGTSLEISQTRQRMLEFRELRLSRRSTWLCSLPANLLQSLLDVYCTRRYFRNHCVAAVVGLGAASMTGPVLAAAIAGVPRILLEQNVLPGRATRLLCRLAQETVVSWEETMEMLPHRAPISFLGNPVRPEAVGRCRAEGAVRFGHDPTRRTVLVLGGSQGASSINAAFCESADTWAREGLQIIHLAGDADADAVEERYSRCGAAATVLSFCDEMEYAYAAADLVVSRAGGSAIAEIAANARPAVLVPYPYAADRHQHLNARAFARSGACVVVEEGEGFPERIRETVTSILRNREELSRMASSSAAIARPDSASRVASRIMEIARCWS